MTTTETTLPPTAAKRPPTRTLLVESDPFSNGGLIRITVNGKATTYRSRMIPCDPAFGPYAVELAKVNDDHDAYEPPYHLTVSSPDPAKAVVRCDCMGHERHGRCKHSDALRVLLTQLAD